MARLRAEERGLSESAWSKTAGSRGYVHSVKVRLERDPNASGDPDKLARLAESAGVDPVWLVTGHGTPDGQLDHDRDRYPSRVEVLAAARASRTHSEGAIAAAEVHVCKSDGDPGRSYWWAFLDTIEEELEGRHHAAESHPDFEDAP